jgi:ribonuclease HI
MTNSSHLEEEIWVPPPKDIIQVNWVASLDAAKKIIGIGIIARDEHGKFLTAISKQESIEVEPVVAETFAALTAITVCLEQNFQDVIFEGDALQVVNEVNSDKHCSSYYGHLVEDVKHGLKRLKSAKFSHVRRSANVAAHELAMVARPMSLMQLDGIFFHQTSMVLYRGKDYTPPLDFFALFEQE